MALNKDKLRSIGANAKAAAHHVYNTNDTLTEVLANDYFNGVTERFKVGDTILVRADEDGTPVTAILSVTVNTDAGDVTVANEFKGGVAI